MAPLHHAQLRISKAKRSGGNSVWLHRSTSFQGGFCDELRLVKERGVVDNCGHASLCGSRHFGPMAAPIRFELGANRPSQLRAGPEKKQIHRKLFEPPGNFPNRFSPRLLRSTGFSSRKPMKRTDAIDSGNDFLGGTDYMILRHGLGCRLERAQVADWRGEKNCPVELSNTPADRPFLQICSLGKIPPTRLSLAPFVAQHHSPAHHLD